MNVAKLVQRKAAADERGGREAPQELASLKGRIQRLNKLVGQHTSSRGNASGPVATSGSPSGDKRSSSGSGAASKAPGGPGNAVPAVKGMVSEKAARAALVAQNVKQTRKTFNKQMIKLTRGDSGKVVGQIIHTNGDAPLPKVQKTVVNGISASHTLKFGGMRSHHYVDGHGEHLQFQCEQWLGTISTRITPTSAKASWGPGERLFYKLLSPGAFGGAIYQASKTWQNVAFRNVTIRYVSCAASTDRGSIYLQYRADPMIPGIDVGTDEVGHATTLGQMVTTSVYNESNVVLEVQPEKMVKELATNDPDPSRFTFGGIVSVAVLDTILKNLTLGDIIVTYDVVFSNPMLSYNVTDEQVADVALMWNLEAGYGGGNQNPINLPFAADAGFPPAAGTAVFVLDGSPPESGVNYLVQLRHLGNGANTAGPVTLNWQTPNSSEEKTFDAGSVFFGTLVDGSDAGDTTWDNSSIYMQLWTVPDVTGSYVTQGPTQVNFANVSSDRNGVIYFEATFIPLPDVE